MSNQFSESAVRAFPATAAHTKGHAVKFSSGNIVVSTAATDKIIGVIDVDNDAGQDAHVRLRSAPGTCVGLAGGTIAVGDKVTSDGAGALIATTTALNEIVGVALEAVSSGVLFEFMPSTGLIYAS
jgi:hypothetical protein